MTPNLDDLAARPDRRTGFTILTSVFKKRAAKTHRRLSSGAVESIAYDSETYWRAAWAPLASFDDMVARVVPLQEQQHSIVILGQPKDGVDLSQPVRRKKSGAGAAFTDALVRVLPIDLDNIRADHLDVIGDPGGAIQYALDAVAEHAPEIEGASCLAIFSSTAGVRDVTTAKLRLWYWLERPYPLADLKRWTKQVNERAGYKLIDAALYQAVQPIYVARPSFDGMPDPLPGMRRWCVVRGHTEAVDLVIDAETPRKPYTRQTGDGLQLHFGGGVEARLEAIGKPDIHGAAVSAIAAFVAQQGAERAEQQAEEFIERVAEIIRGVDPGGRSPEEIQSRIDELPRSFAWALDRQKQSEAERIFRPFPTDTRPRLPLKEAREALREMVGSTAQALLAAGWSRDTLDNTTALTPPPAAHCNATLGVGKTEAAAQTALDLFSAGVRPIAIATPTHKLNKEIRDRIRAMVAERSSAARIAMAMGREALDPDGDGKATMCTQLDTVREVLEAGIADVQGHVCRRVVVTTDAEGNKIRTEHLCPDFHGCRYQENAEEVKETDIVLVSHAALGHRGAREYAFVVVDESPIPAMLRGVDKDHRKWVKVSPAELSPIVTTKAGVTDKARTTGFEIDNPELVEMRCAMAELRSVTPLNSPVRRSALRDIGFTADALRTAAGQALALQEKAVRDLVPGMNEAKRRDVLKKAGKNPALRREARLYKLLADFIEAEDLGESCGWVRRAAIQHDDMRHDVWRLTYMAKISKEYTAPTALLDATMRADFHFALKQLWPGLRDDMGGEILAAAPHRKVRLHRTTSWTIGQTRDTRETADEERGQRAAERALEAQAVALREVTAAGGGKAVIVTYKGVAAAMGKAPVEGVDGVHFALVRGLDHWRHARYQATFGRPQPSPEAAEIMAGAITGRAVEPIEGWYPKVQRPIVGRGGGEACRWQMMMGWQEVPYHPDTEAEACRWQITEAALIQSERLRGVERDADTPALWDLIGCPVPDGVEVDEVIDYEPPSAADLMFAAGGVKLENPAHAVRAYPAIWPVVVKEGESEAEAEARTVEAMRKGVQSGGVGHSLNRASH